MAVKKKAAARWSGQRKEGCMPRPGRRPRRRTGSFSGKPSASEPGPRRPSPRRSARPSSARASIPSCRYPKQHLAKPGNETELEPRPQYEAPEYRGSGKLEGKVALITGGDSGIGRAVAVLFAREGADVAIVYLSEDEDAEETRRAVEAEGRRALLIPGDVTSSAFCREAVESTVQEFGRLDILVNNAAFQEHAASLEDITDEQLDQTFRTNIFGYFYMARAALPHLGKGAAIINTGLGDRDRREQGAAGLLLDQGRHPRLHQVAVAERAGPRHPGELRGAGTGLDAAQPGRPGRGGRGRSSAARCR